MKFLLQVLGDRIPGRCNKTPSPSAAVGFPWGGFVHLDPPQLPSSQREFPTQLGSVRCAGLLHFSGNAFSFNSPVPKTQTSKEFTAWSRLLDASGCLWFLS